MLDEGKHVYYWAWTEYDNPKHNYRDSTRHLLFRVFRAHVSGKLSQRIHDEPITEAMSKAEAIEYCQRIVKLTGGREL
jgi:hypothetical protein